MMRALTAFVVSAILSGCGGGSGGPDAGDPPPSGPYDPVDLIEDLKFDGLEGPVHVVRDEYGVLHIHADNTRDLAFVQGYMMAHDRLPQMDILRRFGAGTLGEIFGALDRSVIDTDLQMRVHRMRPLAEQSLEELRTSGDATDAAIVAFLERFADGVNAYSEDVVAGKYELDPMILVSWDPARFRPWSPVDSLVLGRFQQFALSWTAPLEVDVTDIYQAAVELYDESAGIEQPGYNAHYHRRRGAARDLMRTAPIDKIPTIDGFPNIVDTGSRADGSGSAMAAAGPRRPAVPKQLLEQARSFFRPRMTQGPQAFMAPRAGSNNWVVGPEHAGGKTLIAGDQHLSLPNPSIFYPVHLVVPGELDVQGITFPGIPGVILGHNGKVAWQATTAYHDVNDVYLETIAPCNDSSDDCVFFDNEWVPIERVEEEIQVGALGTITDTVTATYEYVPHHGMIIPGIEDGELVPRSGSQALSVRYTGHEPSFEIRTVWELARAQNVDEAFAAFRHFSYGAQNWVIADNQGNIGWTTNARVPLRDPSAYTWDPVDQPHGLSPMFVLPGDGSAEWQGFMDPRFVPHAINPDSGYLITANSDPVGSTFDGKPLDGPVFDGRPLYVGAFYAPGLRTGRIARLIQGHIYANDTITLDDLAAIQHDSRSTVGAHLRDPVVTALDSVDANPPKEDVYSWLEDLPAERIDNLRAARDRLQAWSLEASSAALGSPGPDEVADAVATTIFNAWMHFFLDRALGDEFAELGWNVYDINENAVVRTVYAMLVEPETMGSAVNGISDSPILCDDMRLSGVNSCELIVLMSMDDALEWLASEDGFGTDDMDAWVWGELHRLTLEPLFPEQSLHVPSPTEPDPALRGGYPSPGDNFVVNRADCGWDDLDFSHQADGAAQRFLAEIEPGGTVRARMSLPGGTVYNRSSRHYRNLFDEFYMTEQQFYLPYSTDEVVSSGEDRWVFRTP